jgi:peptidoglycan/xylan/chitin deacetylase (PgdA/CDA1 family)
MPRERRSKYANDAKDTVGIASQVESLSLTLAQSQTKLDRVAYKPKVLTGEVTYNANYKPLFTVMADDGNKENYTILRQLAIEKGFKFSACVYVKPLEENQPYMMTIDELLTLQSEGHEIMSHGYAKDAQITLLDKTEWNKELGYSKDYLISKGFDIQNFVYQGGAVNNDVINSIRNYYDSAWAIEQKTNIVPFHNYLGLRHSFDQIGTLSTIKTKIDEIYTNGVGWVVVMIHPHFTEWAGEPKKQELRDLIDYVKSKNIEIVTAKEGLKIYGNTFDMGGGKTSGGSAETDYLKVTKFGKLIGSYNRSFSQTRNSVMLDTPPSFFDENSVNVTYHDSQTTATGFPKSNQGLLLTFKAYTSFVVQEWYPSTDKTAKYVRVSTNTTTWGAFNRVTLLGAVKMAFTIVVPQVPANSTVKVTVDISTYALSKETPVAINFGGTGVPDGILVFPKHDGATLTFTFFNTTSSAVNLNTMYAYATAINS